MTQDGKPADVPDVDEAGETGGDAEGVPDAAAPDASHGATPKRRGGALRWLTIVVVIVSASVLAALAPDIGAWLHLHRWSSAGPRRTAEALRTAIDAGDAAALRELMLAPAQVVEKADGSIALRAGTQPGAATMDLARLRMDPMTDDTDIQYITVLEVPEVRFSLPLADEVGEVTVFLVRDSGWRVATLRVRGGVMREIRGPLSPAAKQKSGSKAKTRAEDEAADDQPSTKKGPKEPAATTEEGPPAEE